MICLVLCTCAGVLLRCLCDAIMMRCVLLYGLFVCVVFACVLCFARVLMNMCVSFVSDSLCDDVCFVFLV